MEWLENLDDLQNCPPSTAQAMDMTFYRLVDKIPATVRDFYSYRKLNSEGSFSVPECQARSCSVFSNLQKAIKMQAKLKKIAF